MAIDLVDDFQEWVTEAQKEYIDNPPHNKFVVAQEVWEVSEAISYLIGIDPRGAIVSKLNKRDGKHNNGKFDPNMAEISLAYSHYTNLIFRAILAKTLQIIQTPEDQQFLYVDEVLNWAEKKRLYINADLLKEWKAINQDSNALTKVSATDEESLGRREQQHEVILAVIAALKYDPLQIPNGGKAGIKKICLTCPRSFTDASFDHAWKRGVSAGLFKLANHNKYSPN
jgi:hypothetical protein